MTLCIISTLSLLLGAKELEILMFGREGTLRISTFGLDWLVTDLELMEATDID